ncbi:SGNH/GDSL hydrolase family protein [Novipirellula sp. SH528]|uniref:SGNH/GDSL hydrolase family protein n=1 Tax=Novipirellula sp. SH528 TaxID=3454466 RepID=UPI003F9FECA6
MKDTHVTDVADGKCRSLTLKRFFQGITTMKAGTPLLCVVLSLAATIGASAQELASKDELYTDKEFSNAFAMPEDDPDLPNVLLIGDSISIGYTVDVRKRLSGKADVFRIPSNGKYAAFGSENLDTWLGKRNWDVIHFNWGLWDICYRNPKSKTQGHRDKVNGTLTASPDQYRESLQQIVALLKQTDATLIWCTTTPVPEFEAGRKVGDDIKYNLVAESIMKKNGIRINDLHAHALRGLPGIQKQKGDVHFTSQGYAYLAEKVALEIASALSAERSETEK